MQRRVFLKAIASVTPMAAGLRWNVGYAQEKYPSKAINLIVAYVPGGSADLRARQIGSVMGESFGKSIIVQNRSGAGGNIGTEMIAKAKADGYTVGIGNLAPLSVNPFLYENLAYDPLHDLTMIALIEKGPLMLVVPPNSKYHSVSDLVSDAQKKPGGLSYGSSGIGSAHHLAGELLKLATGISSTHIPYRGGAAAMVDLLGGRLDFQFEPMYSAVPYFKSGKVRALAITGEHRSPIVPDVPTMIELGFADLKIENWQGLIGPAGLSKEIVDTLNTAVNNALQDPSIRAQILKEGNEVGGGTPEEFTALVKSESANWSSLINTNEITVK